MMSHPNLDNISLRPGEREELERLFARTDQLSEEMKRDPEVARRLLERIGYFEMMKDQQEEEDAVRNGAASHGASPNENGHNS